MCSRFIYRRGSSGKIAYDRDKPVAMKRKSSLDEGCNVWQGVTYIAAGMIVQWVVLWRCRYVSKRCCVSDTLMRDLCNFKINEEKGNEERWIGMKRDVHERREMQRHTERW